LVLITCTFTTEINASGSETNLRKPNTKVTQLKKNNKSWIEFFGQTSSLNSLPLSSTP
jgi:hypothetical protein